MPKVSLIGAQKISDPNLWAQRVRAAFAEGGSGAATPTLAEAAEALAVSPSTLERWLSEDARRPARERLLKGLPRRKAGWLKGRSRK